MTSKFAIEISEYEQKRHIFDMYKWINEKLSQLETEDSPGTLYFERKGTNVKKLIEEATPTCYLGLYFLRLGDDVYIQCLAGNQPFDAILEVRGRRNIHLKVEVTTTETANSTLRRQSMARHGFSYGAGPIQRVGRDIVSEVGWVNTSKYEKHLSDLAFERAQSNLDSGKYSSDTVILVSLDSWMMPSLESRAALIRKTGLHLLKENSQIYGIYYCYTRQCIVDGIKCGELP